MQKSKPKQAILILLDAARPDRFSCYGYNRTTTPVIDKLAKRGVVFENHFAQGTTTRSSLPTFFYSRYYNIPIFPSSSVIPLTEPEDLFRKIDDESISLPKAYSRHGFKTVMISAHTWLRKDTPLGAEFDEVYDLSSILNTGDAYPSAEKVMDFTISWMNKNQDNDYFLYLHLMDTHFPHSLNQEAKALMGDRKYSGDFFMAGGFPKSSKKTLDNDERYYLDCLYDGSLNYADRQVGRLVDCLDSTERLDDTLIMITSDHGEHLIETPGRFSHGGKWYDAVARIPLVVFYPRKVNPDRVKAFTESVDLLPTSLNLMELNLPEGKTCDGESLFPIVQLPGYQRNFAFMAGAIRDNDNKCIFHNMDKFILGGEELPKGVTSALLYDLASDPLETLNIWPGKTDEAKQLLTIYKAHMMRPYTRYNKSVSHEQPRSGFAIACMDFKLNKDIPQLYSQLTAKLCDNSKSKNNWLLSRHFSHYWLLAHKDAKSLEITIPIPNGKYKLSASIMGSCKVTFGESKETVELHGAPFIASPDAKCKDAHLGTIDITDECFRIILSPDTEKMLFLIRSFGFDPVIPGMKQDSGAKERLERLKELGYAK